MLLVKNYWGLGAVERAYSRLWRRNSGTGYVYGFCWLRRHRSSLWWKAATRLKRLIYFRLNPPSLLTLCSLLLYIKKGTFPLLITTYHLLLISPNTKICWQKFLLSILIQNLIRRLKFIKPPTTHPLIITVLILQNRISNFSHGEQLSRRLFYWLFNTFIPRISFSSPQRRLLLILLRGSITLILPSSLSSGLISKRCQCRLASWSLHPGRRHFKICVIYPLSLHL